jgi:hypothetical protein
LSNSKNQVHIKPYLSVLPINFDKVFFSSGKRPQAIMIRDHPIGALNGEGEQAELLNPLETNVLLRRN